MDFLSFCYQTLPGRILLRPLISRPVTEICGFLLDSRSSAFLIRPFIKLHHIQTEEYDLSGIRSFNDFFCRPLKPGRREIDTTPAHLIAPCDGLLQIYPIEKGTVLPVKQVPYTVEQLLHSRKLAEAYEGGLCFVFRLCVEHYHRYVYADGGQKSGNRHIPGVFHTVRPVALGQTAVFAQNSREYTVIKSPQFGQVLQMEVGAMLVGRIRNLHQAGEVCRGQEKGCFLYGGSTVIMLLKKDTVQADEQILERSRMGEETSVKLGQMIARKSRKQ